MLATYSVLEQEIYPEIQLSNGGALSKRLLQKWLNIFGSLFPLQTRQR